jgi:hypothetical protein
MAPYVAITDLVDSLSCPSPHDALLALAYESERTASLLANELSSSLLTLIDNSGTKITKINNNNNTSTHGGRGGGIPLPKSLRDAPLPSSSTTKDEGNSSNTKSAETPSRALHRLNPSHPLTHATMASESILSSLSKIASGG